ncbi:hypothetical protein [Caballeronia sp. dw_19]|uniref:hypothetical protein n=1 Tax=Caballeronia sp. dw_19 TaxID=2719791 RepID=UPI001BD46174|nr:hypothetical protein [Caballeronia sp. dw_19]
MTASELIEHLKNVMMALGDPKVVLASDHQSGFDGLNSVGLAVVQERPQINVAVHDKRSLLGASSVDTHLTVVVLSVDVGP